MKESCPGQEGHPPSRVNFSERLYEKKLTPLPESRAGRACSDRLALTELLLLTLLCEPKCSFGEKLARLGR